MGAPHFTQFSLHVCSVPQYWHFTMTVSGGGGGGKAVVSDIGRWTPPLENDRAAIAITMMKTMMKRKANRGRKSIVIAWRAPSNVSLHLPCACHQPAYTHHQVNLAGVPSSVFSKKPLCPFRTHEYSKAGPSQRTKAPCTLPGPRNPDDSSAPSPFATLAS